jgi:hypothetical protein
VSSAAQPPRSTRPQPTTVLTTARRTVAQTAVWIGRLDRGRSVVLALPEVDERVSHGAPCFFVRDTRPVCHYHDHHNDGRVTLWMPVEWDER